VPPEYALAEKIRQSMPEPELFPQMQTGRVEPQTAKIAEVKPEGQQLLPGLADLIRQQAAPEIGIPSRAEPAAPGAPITVTDTLRNVLQGPARPPVESAQPVAAGEVPSGAPPIQQVPESGISTERLQQTYGKDAVLITKGKSAKAWKAIGEADTRDPYAILSQAQRRGMIAAPEDAPLLRAEHQRLLEVARQSYGTPEYDARAQNAIEFANATKQVVHGPASEIFRSLQEADKPTYMSPADFDNIIRERIGKESAPEQAATFKKISDDVRNADTQTREAAANGQNELRKFRPGEVISFDKAADFIKNRIKELTKDCV
jgi:hypothetical protein